MTRARAARVLTGVTSLGFLATAGLHSTGTDSVVRLAREVPGDMGALMPALWLVFSSDLVVIGLIVGVLAYRPSDVARPVLFIAGLCPFATVGLQLATIGFVPPTALLIVLGLLAWASAITWQSLPGR